MLFFHNKFDRQSTEALNCLPPDTVIFDYYASDKPPRNYFVSQLPYLVDKELVLITPEPFYIPSAGVLTLEWECRDKDGNLINDIEPVLFFKVDDEVYDEKAQNGIYSIDFVIDEPTEFNLVIFDDGNYGFHPWEGIIKVVENDG